MVQATQKISRDLLMHKLSKQFPEMFLRTTEEFNRAEGGIWTSGENGLEFPNGDLVFNYWSEDWKGEKYIMGVHKRMYEYLEKYGWYASWYDAGTIMIWEI